MPKSIAPLSEALIRTAKRKDKDYKLYDGAGLALLIYANENRQKLWLFDYSFQNKRKSISFGTYPQVSLAEARKKRQEAKDKIAEGIDPSEDRKEKKATQNLTFKDVAEKWLLLHEDKITKNTFIRKKGWLTNHIYPLFGNKDFCEIKRLDIMNLLQTLQTNGIAETADRISNMLNNIWKYATMFEIVEHNIIATIDKKTILPPRQKNHYPTITDPKEIGVLLRTIEEYKGDINTKLALMISPYLFLRSFNIRALEWKEVDFEKREIKIPGPKMKMKAPHIVPLTDQTIEILKKAYVISAHCSTYVFPSAISNVKTMSNNTLNYALRRLGYTKEEIVYHGLRAMASTIMHEKISEHGIHSDAIERQLAHAERSGVKAAYNHAEYLKERRILMQWWSDYLDKLKKI